ncbi:RNA polymerase sigma-70 factor [Niabella terrae]
MKPEAIRKLLTAITESADQSAFDCLVRNYIPGLVSYVTVIVNDHQLAEEIAEDVFVKLWQNRSTLLSISNFSQYLYTAARYTAFSRLRVKRPLVLEDAPEDHPLHASDPETACISKENLSEIEAAINGLPPKCRLVFRLVKEEGLKYEETARLLDLSVKTVEAQMYIAIKRLSTTLKSQLLRQRPPARLKA